MYKYKSIDGNLPNPWHAIHFIDRAAMMSKLPADVLVFDPSVYELIKNSTLQPLKQATVIPQAGTGLHEPGPSLWLGSSTD